jgi:hypothetical protein
MAMKPGVSADIPHESLELLRPLLSRDRAIRYKKARELVTDVVKIENSGDPSKKAQLGLILALDLSSRFLKRYSTLDYTHVCAIEKLVAAIDSYSKDQSQKRPLNVLMVAPPGAGKSHFVKCLADRPDRPGQSRLGSVTFNMAGLQRHEDLVPALDAVRNMKVNDQLPLLFLDEFDARSENFAVLLPLLWEGQLTVGQHDLRLGKSVIVLAGSTPIVPARMKEARNMARELPKDDSVPSKLDDLLSRINGGELHLPDLRAVAQDGRSADKSCILVSLLRARFGPRFSRVPLAILRFVANVDFRYGVRSMAHFVDSLPYPRDPRGYSLAEISLPLGTTLELRQSSLACHLYHEEEASGIISLWKDCAASEFVLELATEILETMGPLLWLSSETMNRVAINRIWDVVEDHNTT